MTNKVFSKQYSIKKESGYEVTLDFIEYDYDCVELRITKFMASGKPDKPILDVTSGIMLSKKSFKALMGEFSNDLKGFIDAIDD